MLRNSAAISVIYHKRDNQKEKHTYLSLSQIYNKISRRNERYSYIRQRTIPLSGMDIETSIRSPTAPSMTTSSNMERLEDVDVYHEDGGCCRVAKGEIGRGGVRALRGRDSVILNSSLPSRLLPSTTHPTLPSSCHRASLGSFRDPRNPLMRGSRGCRRGGREGGGEEEARGEREVVHPGIHEHPRVRGSLPAAAENDDTESSLSLGGQHRRIYTVCVSSCREPIKRERLENCASPVSPGWKPGS